MKITQEIKIQINELYKEIGSYAGVARVIGIAPTTVKKYVDPNYVCQKDLVVRKCNILAIQKRIEDFVLPIEAFDDDNLLQLSEAEEQEIHELWEELQI